MIITIYRDRHLDVVDKPPGLPVVAGRDGGDCVADQVGLSVTHRLDEGTSGCLVLARTPEALSRVNGLFAAGKVEKTYLAVTEGPIDDQGSIDVPIGEWRRGRVTIGRGRHAHTEWTVRWRQGRRAGVVLRPTTGRTHQLRAHLSQIGAPIVGDPTYGGPRADRLYLHAWRLRLPWDVPGGWLELEAPVPAGFDT